MRNDMLIKYSRNCKFQLKNTEKHLRLPHKEEQKANTSKHKLPPQILTITINLLHLPINKF